LPPLAARRNAADGGFGGDNGGWLMSRLDSQAEDDSREALDRQREKWQRAFSERADRYGLEPSAAALAACGRFERIEARRLLELGGGQGRDSLFFAERGFEVTVLDYTPSAVETIVAKAEKEGLAGRISAGEHDVREPLPFPDGSFDGCYSHMLFCMALTEDELRRLSAEIRRVLRPGGVCVYTARTVKDADFGRGTHRAEDIYELDGFAVHFFSRSLVERLADGYDLVEIEEFEEGALPRRLFRVTLRKP
jgi:SAM-dependent methyltransferase